MITRAGETKTYLFVSMTIADPLLHDLQVSLGGAV